ADRGDQRLARRAVRVTKDPSRAEPAGELWRKAGEHRTRLGEVGLAHAVVQLVRQHVPLGARVAEQPVTAGGPGDEEGVLLGEEDPRVAVAEWMAVAEWLVKVQGYDLLDPDAEPRRVLAPLAGVDPGPRGQHDLVELAGFRGAELDRDGMAPFHDRSHTHTLDHLGPSAELEGQRPHQVADIGHVATRQVPGHPAVGP